MSKRSRRTSRSSRKNISNYEILESKRLLASVGWDGVGQGSAELTYFVGDAPAEVGQETFENVIEQALDVWSDVVDITFTQTDFANQRDSLDVTFQSLDGEGGTLAQAYFPDDVNRARIAGDIQFDSSESWEVGNDSGSRATDLLYVAVHEIGHALGLEHSDADGSVLEATVSPNQFFTSLDDDDRDAALALYAPAIISVDPATPTDSDTTDNDFESPIDESETETETEVETPVDTDTTDENTDEQDTPIDSDEEADEDDVGDEDESNEDEDEETDRRQRLRNFLNRLNRFFNRRFQFFLRFH